MLLKIFSPDCSPWLIISGQPSREAIHAHGALRFEGSFQLDRLTETERSLVLGELAALSFARVPATTALRLIALSPIRQLRGRIARWMRRTR